MTTLRIQKLEKWVLNGDYLGAAWKDRLNELELYRKIEGHSNVPQGYNLEVAATWVRTRGINASCKKERCTWPPLYRVQALEVWVSNVGTTVGAAWEVRLSGNTC
jgi:hypothetical protein